MYEICGMILEHHTTVHMMEHALGFEWGMLPGSEDISALVIPISQVFHCSLGIVSDHCPTHITGVNDRPKPSLCAIETAERNNIRLTLIGSFSRYPNYLGHYDDEDIVGLPLYPPGKNTFKVDLPQKSKTNQKECWRAIFGNVAQKFKWPGKNQEPGEPALPVKYITMGDDPVVIAKLDTLQTKVAELSIKDSEVPIRLEGRVRGRIIHLSPPLLGSDDVQWSKSPTLGGNAFVKQELGRIKVSFETHQSLLSGEKMKHPFLQFRQIAGKLLMAKATDLPHIVKELNDAAKELADSIGKEALLGHHWDPLLNDELDLVCANGARKSIIAFLETPEIPDQTNGSEEQSEVPALLHHLLCQARPHVRLQTAVWATFSETTSSRSSLDSVVSIGSESSVVVSPEAYRIAIEESGFICFVPAGAQLNDLVCFFPQSDVVAVVRESENIAQLAVRAVGLFKHSSHSPLRVASETWPNLNVPIKFEEAMKGLFLLDIGSLQMLITGQPHLGASPLPSKII
jgi:hypothetical protein